MGLLINFVFEYDTKQFVTTAMGSALAPIDAISGKSCANRINDEISYMKIAQSVVKIV